MIRVRPVEFVRRATLQVQLQLAELRLGNYNRVLCQGELRIVCVPGFRKEDAVPLRAASGNIVDVQHRLGKALIENAGLDLKGNLVGDEVGFDDSKGAQGRGTSPKRHESSDKHSAERKHGDRKKNASASNAERSKRDDFAVSRHATEAEEDADENGHRHGKCKYAGEQTEEKSYELVAGAGMADEKLHKPDKLWNEKDKSEDDEAQERMTKNFADDVTIQDAHEAFAECSTQQEGTRAGCRR